MAKGREKTADFTPPSLWRILAIVGSTLIVPPMYGIVGFDLFDGIRSAGLGPTGQSLVFGTATAVVVGWLSFKAFRSNVSFSVVGGALLVVLAALIVNWDYPAKFVHVPQYVVVGAMLSALMRPWEGGAEDQGSAALTAALLLGQSGLTDELVQGFLSARTFGMDDLAVDFAAGGGGYLLTRRRWCGAEFRSMQLAGFAVCCVMPSAAALGFLLYVCQWSAVLELPPPSLAFVPITGAALCCLLFPVLSRRSDASVGTREVFAFCLGGAALGLMAIYGILVSLPLVFR